MRAAGRVHRFGRARVAIPGLSLRNHERPHRDRDARRPALPQLHRPPPALAHRLDQRVDRQGLPALAQIYRPAYTYRRCGVLLSESALDDTLRTSLFTNDYYHADKRTLMGAIDHIGAAHGQHARKSLSRGWRMRQTHRSPRYTTHWDELPVAQ